MKVRVLYNPDKSVSIIYPVPKSRRINETEEEWLERVFSKANPNKLPYDDLDSSALPSREFRCAWEGEKGKHIIINQDKIQETEREKQIAIEEKRLLREQAKANLGLLTK